MLNDFYPFKTFLLPTEDIYLNSEYCVFKDEQYCILKKVSIYDKPICIFSFLFISINDTNKYFIGKKYMGDFLIYKYKLETINMKRLYDKFFNNMIFNDKKSISNKVLKLRNYLLESNDLSDFLIKGLSDFKNHLVIKDDENGSKTIAVIKNQNIDFDMEQIDTYQYVNAIYGTFLRSILSNI